jgi:nitrite transporter NirC
MFKSDIETLANSAQSRLHLLKTNLPGYLVASMLAGFFVGIGVISFNVVGGYFQGNPAVKLLQGTVFTVALSLVIVAGAELFTGNNLIMTVGFLEKKLNWNELLLAWLVCFVGNWAGAVLLAVLFNATGLLSGQTLAYAQKAVEVKASLPFTALLVRGIFCNILVCLAIWSCTRLKSESAKLIMVFWCILTFVMAGFEHSVANMSSLTMAILHPGPGVINLGNYLYVLFTSALGNMIGGIGFVALPYWLISREKEAKIKPV